MSHTVTKYGEDPLEAAKLFHYSKSNSHTLIYIHGGAWRDPNNTYDDFSTLAEKLDNMGVNLVGINYKLSPKYKHPSHIHDIVRCLDHLNKTYDIKQILIVGHSVGAFMALQLLNYQHFVPDCGVELNVDIFGMILVDGIYDVVELLEEYGDSYRDFVADAFHDEAHYREASQVLGKMRMEPSTTLFEKAIIVQSSEDELLSGRQLECLMRMFHERKIPFRYIYQNLGKHDEVYRSHGLFCIIHEFLKDNRII